MGWKMRMQLLWLAPGLAIVIITLLDVFQTVLVPRPTGRRWRPSAFLTRGAWKAWGFVAQRYLAVEAREDVLGAFAPLMLVMLLAFWIASLIVGYGLAFYALREQIKPVPGFFDSLYFAGTSLLTIGYGDITPTGGMVRVLSICAGASGFGAFSIITTFLFALFGAYQTREAYVVMFSNRYGAPPSGVHFIEAYSEFDDIEGLRATLREAQVFISQVLETHLAYPVLTYFRSTHDGISWIAVIG
ncbi:MAG: two pore domain potassium channel family protein, partial [Candidatus Eremiobacteraeota bacterium]|nr:two pore domain potassium channel family protein [Candidatus Eremiobacteraeota bacterium]